MGISWSTVGLWWMLLGGWDMISNRTGRLNEALAKLCNYVNFPLQCRFSLDINVACLKKEGGRAGPGEARQVAGRSGGRHSLQGSIVAALGCAVQLCSLHQTRRSARVETRVD